MSIGFAAFSKTLTINSATVNTTARTNVFETAIHYDTNAGITVDSVDAIGVFASLQNPRPSAIGTLTTDTWSGINLTMNSNYKFGHAKLTATIVNESTEYDAFLLNLTSNGGVITCTPVGDTNPDLVANACSSLTVTVTIHDVGGNIDESATLSSSMPLNRTNIIGGAMLAKGNSTTMDLYFNYDNSGTLPDGQYTVTVPAIQFEYTSHDNLFD